MNLTLEEPRVVEKEGLSNWFGLAEQFTAEHFCSPEAYGLASLRNPNLAT